MLAQDLPPAGSTLECAAALHQLSWAMRLQALLLLRLDHEESAQVRGAWWLAPAETVILRHAALHIKTVTATQAGLAGR